MQSQTCRYCGADVSARFCSQCGGKVGKKDISLKSMLLVVLETVTNWEQKMSLTIKCLFTEPGKVPRSFIHGDRKKYIHPIKFVMFWAGVNMAISVYMKSGMGKLEPSGDKLVDNAQQLITNNYALMWIFCIPFLSLATFLVYRKSERKFVFHNVILCYVAGVNLIIGIPNIIMDGLWKSFETMSENVFWIFPLLYCICMFQSYFRQAIWKSILSGVLCFVFIAMGYAVLFVIVYGLMYLYEII